MGPEPDQAQTNSITVGMANMKIQRRHLLELPPEIRIRIYTFVFVVNEVILLRILDNGRIFQPTNDLMRAGKLNDKIHLPAQFLRTCSQVYHEASPFLLCSNDVEILDIDTHNLDKISLPLPTRMLMTKVRFCNRTDERLNLSTIGNCFPSLRHVNIHTQGTGAPFLILAYELSKCLPCSDIRRWPTLELHVQVPQSKDAITDFKQDAQHGSWYELTKNTADTIRIRDLFHTNKNTFRLTAFEPFAQQLCGLGAEMPEFSTIILHGGLMREYLPALMRYESSYGDCKFTFVREEPMLDKQGYVKTIYVWHRKDGAVATAVRGRNLENTTALMRRWVPALSPEFVKAIAEAGL